MKKYTASIALVLMALIQPAQAALPTGATLFDVTIPSLSGGPTFGVTALHWETATPHYDYALTFPHDDSDSFALDGTYHSVDPDSRWNFKLNLGYIFPCTGNDITLAYLGYHQDSIDLIRINPFIAEILPTLSTKWPTTGTVTIGVPFLSDSVTFFFPGTIIDDVSIPESVNPNLAKAKANINHHVVDLDVGQFINIGNRTRIKYYGGLRYASLESDLDATYNYSAVDPTDILLADFVTDSAILINLGADFTETVQQSSDYAGIGPHLGIDFNHYLCWGFGFVSNISTSLLVGEIDTQLREKFIHSNFATVVGSTLLDIPVGTTFTNTVEEHSDFNYPNTCRIVPNIDAKVGIDWSYLFCNCSHSKLTVEAGYMVSHYFNVVDRVADITIEPQRRHTLDEYFEGLYLSLQVNI